MSIQERLEQIKKSIAFTKAEFDDYYMTRTLGSHASTAEREYQRLAPIITALCEVIEQMDGALDWYALGMPFKDDFGNEKVLAQKTQSQVAAMLAKIVGDDAV